MWLSQILLQFAEHENADAQTTWEYYRNLTVHQLPRRICEENNFVFRATYTCAKTMSTGSFAAAQERILVRQAARRTENEELRRIQDVAASALPLARLPFPLNQTAGPLYSFWNTLFISEGTKPAFRVGQVDAELLDEELLNLLQGQVGEAIKYFGGHLQDDWSQEILLALRASLFKLSVWDHDVSYGASLQNLKFIDARKGVRSLTKPSTAQKSLYGLITVFGRYGWSKWEDWLIEQEGGYNEPSANVRTLSRITSRLSTLHSIAAFTSFIVFLINGRYRTLTDRLLRLRLVSPMSQISREVSFEYLNRQLVWHAFTEFLLFLLPLVGIGRWRRWLSRAWKRTKATVRAKEEGEIVGVKTGPLSFLPESTCAICYQDQSPASTSEAEILGANISAGGGVIGSASTDIVNPYETKPCGCIYCFVCLAQKIEAEEDSGWPCLRCGEVVYKCKPWTGDVVEKRTKNTTKSVGFVVADEKVIDDNDGDSKREIEEVDLPSDLGSSQWTLDADRDQDE